MSAAPLSRTYVATRAGFVPAPRTQTATRTYFGRNVIAFGLIMIVTNFACSLTGQVMLEGARRGCLSAAAQATQAKEAEAVLRSEVEALSRFDSVKEWALSNGLVAPDSAPQPSQGTAHVAIRIP